jgi:hypothetical protein
MHFGMFYYKILDNLSSFLNVENINIYIETPISIFNGILAHILTDIKMLLSLLLIVEKP